MPLAFVSVMIFKNLHLMLDPNFFLEECMQYRIESQEFDITVDIACLIIIQQLKGARQVSNK